MKHPRMIQFIKFAIVGAMNTAIDFAIFNALISFSGGYNGSLYGAAKAVSFSCAVVNSYLWNKYWVFKSDLQSAGPAAKSAGAQEKGTFLVVSLIGLCVNVAVSSAVFALAAAIAPSAAAGAGGARALANLGALCGTAAVLIFNYFGYKRFVFRSRPAAGHT